MVSYRVQQKRASERCWQTFLLKMPVWQSRQTLLYVVLCALPWSLIIKPAGDGTAHSTRTVLNNYFGKKIMILMRLLMGLLFRGNDHTGGYFILPFGGLIRFDFWNNLFWVQAEVIKRPKLDFPVFQESKGDLWGRLSILWPKNVCILFIVNFCIVIAKCFAKNCGGWKFWFKVDVSLHAWHAQIKCNWLKKLSKKII